MTLIVSDHRPLLNTILSDYGLPPDTLELVSDVQATSLAYGIAESSHARQAKCLCTFGRGMCHIIMLDMLSDESIASGKAALEFLGFETEVATLDSELKYLVHLLLHEIACHVLQSTEQVPRDEWAFGNMSKYVA